MTTGLDALRDLILDDPAVAERLDVDHPDAFATLAVEAAGARGLSVDAAEIRAAVVRGPVAMERPVAPSSWLPAEADDQGRVTWLRFCRRRLVEPFYADSLMIARFRPLNRLVDLRTPLPTAADRAPDGLIFHMSRCGSTLAAQMLAASPANVVVAEAAPIEAVLRLPLDAAAKIAALRAMVAALGQPRASETRLFLKLDCWQVRDLLLFRQAFPDTPWTFLYRDPIEVLVSHLRRRGVQMIPELFPPERLGLDAPDAVPDADYCARVLAAICEGAARHDDGLLVNYAELPEALFTRILPHFGVAVPATEAAAMRAAASRDAKAPERDFTPDGAAKRLEADEDLRAICERRVGPIYRRLETMRMVGA